MDKDLNDAIKRVIPNFKTHWNEIKNFINNIPSEENNLKIFLICTVLVKNKKSDVI